MTEGELCLRALAAFGFGAAIGFERQYKNKPAGLRTHIIVCVAAAMLTAASVKMAEDLGVPGEFSRIPQGVITGIGFIGAGTIIKTKRSVTGLTTAGTVFMAAAIGMVAGMGLYWLALTGTGITVFTTWLLQRFDPIIAEDDTLERVMNGGPDHE